MNFKKGFSVVEIIIGSAIITLAGITIVVSLLAYINLSAKNGKNIQTAILFEETAEALQFMRDAGWSTNIENLSTETKYYLVWNGSAYTTTATPNLYQDIYSRSFTLHSVKRDGGDSISDSGTTDPDTFLATISVSYPEKSVTTTRETEVLIHNVYDN